MNFLKNLVEKIDFLKKHSHGPQNTLTNPDFDEEFDFAHDLRQKWFYFKVHENSGKKKKKKKKNRRRWCTPYRESEKKYFRWTTPNSELISIKNSEMAEMKNQLMFF